MPDSIRARLKACSLAIMLALGTAGPGAAQDGTIRLSASTFDRFAAALQPLTVRREGWYHFTVPSFFGPVDVPIYCVGTASVSNVKFTIAPNTATVRGDVSGTMCGLPYTSSLFSPVTMAVNASASQLLVRPAVPLSLNATINILGFVFTIPFNANLAPSLTVLAIPLDVIRVETESPSGPRTLVLASEHHRLSLQAGFVEIRADVHFR